MHSTLIGIRQNALWVYAQTSNQQDSIRRLLNRMRKSRLCRTVEDVHVGEGVGALLAIALRAHSTAWFGTHSHPNA